MAQPGAYTPISLYHSTTPGALPLAANLIAGELALNIADGKLYYNNGGVITVLADSVTNSHLTWDEINNTLIVDATGALQVATGTTGERPATPTLGDIRYNTSTGGFEGYQQVLGVSINSLTNVTTTATANTGLPHGLTTGDTITMSNCTPSDYNGVFTVTVVDTTTFEYTMLADPGGSASIIGSYTYPGWGAIGGGSSSVVGGPIIENYQTVSQNYVMQVTNNGESVGPITVATGVTVTIPTGCRWVVL